MDHLVLRQPDDFHVHLRQGQVCGDYARDAQKAGFARVLVMPNTLPPVADAKGAAGYRRQIEVAAPGLQALMTFKLLPHLDRQGLQEMKEAGVVAGKLYPEGVTTHSEDGFAKIKDAYPLFGLMEELGLVLCIHGEEPTAFSLDRESAFLPQLKAIHKTFPRLRIVLEHVSTAKGLDTVRELGPTVAGTITIHHMLYTLDDMLGGPFKPHLFCKPLVKRPEDRLALQQAALEGSPKFFFGSDSAPHTREHKEACLCSAGVYTMPVSLSLLAQFFESAGALGKLENFTSRWGAEFYGLPLNPGTITLKKDPWTVSKLYHGVVPLMAGETLAWRRMA